MQWQDRWRMLGPIKDGYVFMVESRSTGQKGCLKTMPLHAHHVEDVEFYSQHRRYVAREILSRLRLRGACVNFPSLLDHNLPSYADSSTPLFMVSEWINGPSLEQYLTRGDCSPVAAANVFFQLEANVTAAHRCGVFHGELHGQNVRVSDGDFRWATYTLAFATVAPARKGLTSMPCRE